MKTKTDIIKEAIEVIGSEATNREIRRYAKEKYGIQSLGANALCYAAGNQRERKIRDVTVEELSLIKKASKNFESLERLITCAEAKATTNVW